jgi:hypothetical protein
MADQLSKLDPDGTVIGQSTADKIGFHGVTGTAQRSGAAQATLSITLTASATCVGFTTTAQAQTLLNQVEEIRAALVAKGLIKGSA